MSLMHLRRRKSATGRRRRLGSRWPPVADTLGNSSWVDVPVITPRSAFYVLAVLKLTGFRGGSMAYDSPVMATDRRAAADDQVRQLLAMLPLGLLVIARDGILRVVNEQSAQLLGVDAEDLVGRHWRDCFQLWDIETGAPFDCLPPRTARPQDSLTDQVRLRLVRPDGSHCIVELSRADPLPELPPSWDTVLWLRDCTEDHEELRRLRRLAAEDHLTNLVNRREFERRLAKAIERTRREGTRHVLMFMDLDRFKAVNDRFGHPAGDEVLKHVAETLRLTVRERDTLGRLGGDEFGLLMEHCELEEGRRAAEALRRRLRKLPIRWGGERLNLGISIGIVAIDGDSADLDGVWRQADAACYRAKHRLAVIA
jgi:diguanylate cyclase (GGDEF)-like protein